MTTANEPAFPGIVQRHTPHGTFEAQLQGGLTKREEMAKAAMIGLLASVQRKPTETFSLYIDSRASLVAESIEAADALLAELERTKS